MIKYHNQEIKIRKIKELLIANGTGKFGTPQGIDEQINEGVPNYNGNITVFFMTNPENQKLHTISKEVFKEIT